MNIEKFETEIYTLKTFFELYCKDKHTKSSKQNVTLVFKEELFNLELNLCQECFETINYSFKRLQECPHEIKPRCRKCSNPCYEKPKWKALAKIMKHSAIKLSLSKAKQKVKNIFTR